MEDENKLSEVKKEIEKTVDYFKVEDILKKNTVEFEYKGNSYRVRKPVYKEVLEANNKKLAKYTEFLEAKDDNGKFIYKSEADWIKLHKDRGVDIDAMSKRIANLVIQREKVMLRLGEDIANKLNEQDREKYKQEVQEYTKEIQQLSIEKTNLLGASIENQVMIYYYTYVTYLVTEKKDGENWVKVWNSFTDFEKEDNGLINKASYYASLIATEEIEL